MKYRKKPVVVEAIQWLGNNYDEMREFVKREAEIGLDHVYVYTLEGAMTANKGDYIIKGVNGEFYPCKSDIFKKTYELAEE